MSEGAVEGQGLEGNESQGAPETIDQGSTGNINPAWNDVLAAIPEELHSQVTPHFSKWDQNYQNGIQKVHSEYEPYKFLVENRIQPDQVQYAMSVMQAIESNPQQVLKALQEFVGEEEEQGPNHQSVDGQEAPEWLNHPEFQRVNQMVNQMAQLMVQQRQMETQAAEDAKFQAEIDRVKKELGDFDEEWVLTRMMNNEKLELDDAVKQYHQFEQSLIAKQRQPGPKVLGSGGSIPSPTNNLDVAKLEPKAKRNLIVQMLENSKQNQ